MCEFFASLHGVFYFLLSSPSTSKQSSLQASNFDKAHKFCEFPRRCVRFPIAARILKFFERAGGFLL
ncbi:Putative hypothetical protein [Helicobacter mustelae 12198]|uniref:Uncharacterized protein n=1 Tax=Helicobacter mustelae (strain ATCC 43772 / CCUG 25715 / CIP 103759 / LMG 18044 / NCTC 12198 / R85-136P) TaxID=679897 RepID=D3UJH6_HELM1|nr:Putative hypothetical protein [Helicobacter mustelae 12198]